MEETLEVVPLPYFGFCPKKTFTVFEQLERSDTETTEGAAGPLLLGLLLLELLLLALVLELLFMEA